MPSIARILRARDQENCNIFNGLKTLISNCLTQMNIWLKVLLG